MHQAALQCSVKVKINEEKCCENSPFRVGFDF